jgi:23S rRNA (uracil1939-C5)-methyltransferase
MVRQSGTWFAIPGTLPGERIRVPRSAARAEILEASVERQAPPCRYFGDCGGCRLQHLSATSYGEFKRRLVADALARVGLCDIAVTLACVSPPGSRRRATLKAIRTRSGLLLGLNALRESRIVDLDTCPLLVPALTGLFTPLREALTVLLTPGQKAAIILTATATGVDAGISGLSSPDLRALERLAEFARDANLARLWLGGDGQPPVPVIEQRRPSIRFGATDVTLPPGGFIQATAEGEAALIHAARRALASYRSVADLFSGIGTFSLSLASEHPVRAIEQDRAAVQAMDAACRSGGLVNVETIKRDLQDRPLTADELRVFDAVLFDPPRAGAAAQSRELAASKVSRIVGVSCNPATFARDASILVGGGFRLRTVDVIDQFLWSPHVELISVFDRAS